MNFAFYVSGNGTRLKKILKDKENNQKILQKTRLVFSDSQLVDCIENELLSLGIKYYSYVYIRNDESGDLNLELSNALLKALTENKIGYCFCFGDHILKGNLIEKYHNRIINFHPSLLPAFPGRFAIDKAIATGVKVIGNTAHFIDNGIDTGPIILQNVLPVEIFNIEGYDGILDNQIIMLKIIFNSIMENRLSIENNIVNINGTCKFFNIITPTNECCEHTNYSIK